MRLALSPLVALALAACNPAGDLAPTPMKEDAPVTAVISARTGIPPLDLAVPVKLETATFALG